jgi:hypothetical protein
MIRARRLWLLLVGLSALFVVGTAGSADVTAFDGTWKASFPEAVGQTDPKVNWTLVCRERICTLAMGGTTAKFQNLEPVTPKHLSQAQFALKYAREHKANGKQQAPHLSALLDAASVLSSCIDLGVPHPNARDEERGLTLLCALDRNPWERPVVLLLGTILANCGPAFCRFELFPLFKD